MLSYRNRKFPDNSIIIISYYQLHQPTNLSISPMDSDFQIIKRTSDEAGKYAWVSFNQPDVDLQNSLVVSHADMEFKFSPSIYKRLLQKIGDKPHFGYVHPKKSFWKALSDWITSRYYRKAEVNENTTVLWNNTINAVSGCIDCLTDPNDEVLIICPVYYFFLQIVRHKNRKIVQFLLDTKENRFYIDFQKLEQTIKNKNIKLLIFCNPWNPCGRIWNKQQLRKLSELILRYKFFVISDQIYSDSVQPTQEQEQKGEGIFDVFTSLLVYQQIHKYLVYVNSYSKAFNSSGMPLSYSLTFDEKLHEKMKNFCIHEGDWSNYVSHELLEIVYTSPEAKQWKRKSIDYIGNNFQIFKKQCENKLPELTIYDLQCSYLCLVDFARYNLAGNELKQKFTSVNLCPTFMEKSFDHQEDRSLIRINLAINSQLVVLLVDLMKKMIEK